MKIAVGEIGAAITVGEYRIAGDDARIPRQQVTDAAVAVAGGVHHLYREMGAVVGKAFHDGVELK